MILRSALLFAPLSLLIPGFITSAADYENPSTDSWEVRVTWSTNPNEETSLGFFSSPGSAEAQVQKCKADHAKGGLLYTDPAKPLGFRTLEPKGTNKPSPRSPTLREKVISEAEAAKDTIDKVEKVKFWLRAIHDPDGAFDEYVTAKAKEGKKNLEDASGLKNYVKNIEEAWGRVKDAKDKMMKLEKTTMDGSFKKVNDLVARYNKEVDAGAGRFGGLSTALPRLKPVGPETAKKVEEWRDALKTQFDLEKRKDDLNNRKAELDRDREGLAADWKALTAGGKVPDPADPKVVRLRQRLEAYKRDADKYSTAVNGYTAEVKQFQTVVDRLRGGGTGGELVEDNLKLTDTRWEINGMSFGLRVVYFEKGNKVTGLFNVEASSGEGKWKQTGTDSIEGDFGRFGKFTAKLSGNQLTVTREGGGVVLLNKK